jgi:hypothetical protein
MRLRKLVLAAALALAPAQTAPAQDAGLVVVELFQSQGCSSCPPANANLNALAARPDVLALSWSVTYWDKLGWKDTFAREAFTRRQSAYAKGLGNSQVYTPQVVLNGRQDLVGRNRRELAGAIAAQPKLRAPVAVSPRSVSIGRGTPPRPADVWLVRYDPRVHQVAIKRGENGGKTLPHRNIVRELTRLGGWNGQPASFPIAPPADPAWRTAVLVQASGGGPMLAAGRD